MNNTMIGYIGTYTKGTSQGIYSFKLDVQSGKISEPTFVSELKDPTYLTISSDNQHLYTIYKNDGKGAIAHYKINKNTGELSFIAKSESENGSYCHLSTDRSLKRLVAASYGDGRVESYTLFKDGTISPVASTIQHKGSGPNLNRQEKAHTHYAGFTPDEKFIVVVDLGIDQILTYHIVEDQFQLCNKTKLEPGCGPRHLVFHPNKSYAYVMCELRPEVLVMEFNQENGSFHIIQHIRSVPDDFKENNQGSAIHISSDGHFIYASNRGHDSIAVFEINEDSGKLSFIQLISTEGHWPRDFSLDPTENFLIASNEESGTLTLYARDQQTGILSLLQSSVTVPYPTCVKFLQY